MTGIKEVADEVGLSMATVSRALRGQQGVSADNRRRVQETAARLGYVASSTAVGLATGRTHMVAAVVPHVTRWYFGTVIHGAEKELRAHGYDLLLVNLAGSEETRRRVLQTRTLTKRADAVLLAGLQPQPSEQAWLGDQAVPVVMVGAVLEGWRSVSIDDEKVAETATQHLLDLGHRRIGYIGGSQAQALEFSTPGARHRGFLRTMAAAGVEVPPELDQDGDFTLGSGHAVGLRMLGGPDRPSALFCASDEMALGVLRAARELGLEVPRDLSVIGVDDHELAAYVDLTTVWQPVEELGARAARHLLHLMHAGGPGPGPATHEELDTHLIVRGTTGPPA